MINECETTKLFYDQYFYKLSVSNPIASIFRNKNLTYARQQLDILQLEYENKNQIVYKPGLRNLRIDVEDFVAAKFLLSELSNQYNYQVRVESPTLAIYSNNKKWLNYLKTKPLKIKEFYSPKQENLNLLAKHTIIMKDNNFGYSHKITLKDKVDQRFYKWLTSNPDKVKIGNTCLDSIKKGHYVRGFYFYIKNEKILSLINLMICNDISRIDNIVYPALKDK